MVSQVGQAVAAGITRRTAIVGFGVGAIGAALVRGGMVAAAQESTPTVQALHPAAGVWQWTNSPGEPDSDISYAIMTDDGTYADAWVGRFVSVGEWRATGDRSADLVIVTRELTRLTDLFGSEQVAVPADLFTATPATLWRLAIEFDETGNHFTATGTEETQDEHGAVINSVPYTGLGDRMAVAAG